VLKQLINCTNCGNPIDDLGTVYIRHGKQVCNDCFKMQNKKQKISSFWKFSMWLSFLIIIAGIWMAGYFGYYEDNYEYGGYGIFAGSAGIVMFLFSAIMAMRYRG